MSETINPRNNQSENAVAREAALQAAAHLSVTPTGLVQYQSRGRVAVIGDEVAAEFAPRLEEPLRPQVILLSGAEEPGAPTVSLGGRKLHIEGYLGNFRIHLGDPGKPNYELVEVDLVLDLAGKPQMPMPVPPPGYLHAGHDESALSRALLELTSLVGTFEKPRFFAYDASVCAHGRSGKTACTRCIDACPTQAITSIGDAVRVEPYLCQGGGVCATVCPSGAMQYRYPTASDTLEQALTLLKVYRAQGGKNPLLLFVAEADQEALEGLPDNMLPVVLEEIASVGLEVWLSCLAYGAEAVRLLDTGSLTAGVREALQGQLLTAQEILSALGYPEQAVAFVGPAEMAAGDIESMPAFSPARYSAMGGKRQTFYMALDHLYQQASDVGSVVSLSSGAPFGMVEIEASRCTLCLSCVGVCPGKALQQGDGVPQVRFIEANCLQCEMCTHTCPENAITITPRLLFDRSERSTPRVLHEEEPFCCVSCGKPFATRTVIELMVQRLQGHWMFQDERAVARLRMCEDCRVIDAVQDEQVMQAGFEGRLKQ
jgi:ferredoxin